MAHSLLVVALLAALAACGGDSEPSIELAFGVQQLEGGSTLQGVDEEGAVRTLTRPVAGRMALAPAWSPDGERLAFVRQVPDEHLGLGDLYVRESDGRERLLGPGLDPQWTPDGEQLLVWRGPATVDIVRPRHGEITVVRADGTSERVITGGRRPALAPDGRSVAFVRYSYGAHPAGDCCLLYTSTLSVVSIRGGDSRPVLRTTGRERGRHIARLEWFPGGKRIAVLRGNGLDGRWSLQIAYVGGRREVGIRRVGQEFALAPDGDRFAFRPPTGSGVAVARLSDPTYRRSLSGRVPSPVFGPTWSLDGDELAFWVRDEDASGTDFVVIFVWEVDGDELRRVAQVKGFSADIAWNPQP